MALFSYGYFVLARFDEVWAKDGGGVHPTHCLTRAGIAFHSGDSPLSYLHWQQADRVDVRFRGHKGDQAGEGSVVMRTRDTSAGHAVGAAVGRGCRRSMVELMSCHSMLPEHAPVTSYRSKGKVVTW